MQMTCLQCSFFYVPSKTVFVLVLGHIEVVVG